MTLSDILTTEEIDSMYKNVLSKFAHLSISEDEGIAIMNAFAMQQIEALASKQG